MPTKTVRATRNYSTRAGDLMDRARNEATTSRLIAAGIVAAGAAAYALLRNPARRDRITQSARNYVDRGAAWWNQSKIADPASPQSFVPAE